MRARHWGLYLVWAAFIVSSDGWIYESRADAYRAQGLTEQAIRAYQLAGDAHPKLPGIHLALAQIYLEQKRIEEARHAIEQELTIVPESVAARAIQQRIASAESKP